MRKGNVPYQNKGEGYIFIITQMYGNTCNSISETQRSYETSFLSICPKYFFADFWNVMEDILLNRKPLKNVILQRKTKQKRKG